jgi:hypothetical protein
MAYALLRLAPDTNYQLPGGAMPHDPLRRSPTDVILHVLANGRVEQHFPTGRLPSKYWRAFRR